MSNYISITHTLFQVLESLLERLYPLLRSKTWETRLASVQALKEIAENVPDFIPIKAEPDDEEKGQVKVEGYVKPENTQVFLDFETFDIQKVLSEGKTLAGETVVIGLI